MCHCDVTIRITFLFFNYIKKNLENFSSIFFCKYLKFVGKAYFENYVIFHLFNITNKYCTDVPRRIVLSNSTIYRIDIVMTKVLNLLGSTIHWKNSQNTPRTARNVFLLIHIQV